MCKKWPPPCPRCYPSSLPSNHRRTTHTLSLSLVSRSSPTLFIFHPWRLSDSFPVGISTLLLRHCNWDQTLSGIIDKVVSKEGRKGKLRRKRKRAALTHSCLPHSDLASASLFCQCYQHSTEVEEASKRGLRYPCIGLVYISCQVQN